jgi:hypothetical protein
LQVKGNLNAQNVTLNGTLNFSSGGSAQLSDIFGTGTLTVGDGITSSTVSADSIQTGTLTIGAGSTITINAISGGPQSSGDSLASVPEPSTVVLLIAAALGMFLYLRR